MTNEERDDLINDVLGVIQTVLYSMDDDNLKETAKNTIAIFFGQYIKQADGKGGEGDADA